MLHNNFYSNTQNPDLLGFTGSAIKGVDEYEAARNYVHDLVRSDQGCNDVQVMANGFWAHDTLVVNNSQWSIRYEFSPRVADEVHAVHPTALIEDNEIHGNGAAGSRGGASMQDAQNGTFYSNNFGPTTIAGVSYPANVGGIAIEFSRSDQSNRTDLWNGKAYGNVLGGETIRGCNIRNAPNVVYCLDNVGRGFPWLRWASVVALAAISILVLYKIYRTQFPTKATCG